jgi:hypothetical protein
MDTIISLIIILVIVVLSVIIAARTAHIMFHRKVTKEVTEFFKDVDIKNTVILEKDLERLPLCVRKWLEVSGVIGKERIETVRLKQKGSMRSKPEGPWMAMEAEEYFVTEKAGFIWKARVNIAPFVSLVARDKYLDGKGNMLIKLLSCIPIADAKGKEIDQGSLLRYLVETAWFPTAALSEYITWEPIDSLSARAVMNYGGITAPGIFRFNEQGDMVSFEAQRYGQFEGKYSLEKWFISVKAYKSFGGVRIPNCSVVTWKLKTGDYAWLKLGITGLEFNKPEVYPAP